MPSPNQNHGTPNEWLSRAKGNFALATIDKPENAFWEDLCYNLQQAAEKAIKAVYIQCHFAFHYTRDLETLLANLDHQGIDIPDDVKKAITLTEYAVETRYPGIEPVTEEDYRDALQLAENVLVWAQQLIGS